MILKKQELKQENWVMSSKSDIFDQLAQGHSGESESNDIFSKLAARQKSKVQPWRTQEPVVRNKLERAFSGATEQPSLVATEFPTAALQALEAPLHGPKAISALLSSIINPLTGEKIGAPAPPPKFGDWRDELPIQNQPPTMPSELYSQYAREGLPEELQQKAQDIADIESLLLPGLKGAKGKFKGKKGPDSVQRMYEERASLPPKSLREEYVPDTFESGLSKPGAVEAKRPGLGLISKERQKESIGKLETEAQGLIKSRISERVPITEKMKEGFDFDKYHQEEFGRLKSLAERANPEIDINPLSEFVRESVEKYRGIPLPHGDARSVIAEMKAFRRRPPTDLKDLLRIRRSNTQKLKNIYDQRLMKGKRQEYVDFINNMNRKIDESIEKTLPEDSAWFKQYKKMNQEYSEYRNAQDTLRVLEPLLREKMSSSALKRLAEDPAKQKYLRLKMGEEGANEIIQIAKDVRTGADALKKIKVRDLNKYDAIWPISWVFKPFGVAMTVKKGIDLGRRGYGYILSSPSKRKAFDNMLHAIERNDINAYEKAAENLNETKIKFQSPLESKTIRKKNIDIQNKDFKTFLEKKYPSAWIDITEPKGENYITIDDINLYPKDRGKGTGTQILKDIMNYADKNKKDIKLIPSDLEGNVDKLIEWYIKNGFVRDKSEKALPGISFIPMIRYANP